MAAQCACAVETFHGEAVDNTGVANERHNTAAVGICAIKAVAVERVAARHSDGGGNCGAGVADAEKVVSAFARLWKTSHAIALAKS